MTFSLHLDNGVSFLLQSKIKSFEGDEKKIKKIKFHDGVLNFFFVFINEKKFRMK